MSEDKNVTKQKWDGVERRKNKPVEQKKSMEWLTGPDELHGGDGLPIMVVAY